MALVATALTFVSCGSKKEKEYKPYFPQTGWEEYELKGKVKELHIVRSWSYVGDIENAYVRDSSVIYFNENGQTEKRIINGGQTSYFYTYSGDTCFIERHKNEWLQYGIEDEGDRIDGYQVIVKDKRGNWTSFLHTDLVGEATRNEFSYNDQGFLTEVINYRYGKLLERHEFSEHNENGFYHKQLTYRDNGDLDYTTIWEGEDINHITRRVFMDKDGKRKEESSYEYNEYGFLTKMIGKDLIEGGEEVTEFTYKYDPQGNFVEKIQTTSKSDYITKEERTIIYY